VTVPNGCSISRLPTSPDELAKPPLSPDSKSRRGVPIPLAPRIVMPAR
jgi:hypothetical protein